MILLENAVSWQCLGSARVPVSSKAGWRHTIRQQCSTGRCTLPSQNQAAASASPAIKTSRKAATPISSEPWLCSVLIVPECAQNAHGWHAHVQVSTKLKVGVMFDHNGTYMEGFGFAYRELQVTIEIADGDELAVTLNGKALQLPQSQADLEVIPYVERGEFLLLWQRHREGLGNAVELTTGILAAHKTANFELCLHKLNLYAYAQHPILPNQ